MLVKRSVVWFVPWIVALACGGEDGPGADGPDRRADDPSGAASVADAARPTADGGRAERASTDGGDRAMPPRRDGGGGQNAEPPAADAGQDEAEQRDGSSEAEPDGGAEPMAALDCGPLGVAIENAGPPRNRVNYVILGDGYTQEELESRFIEHIRVAMAKRFGPIGEPYGRYRKFVNICALKIPSESSPIGSGPTAFGCTGDDQSRLARCNQQDANMAIAANLPESFEVDWKAVVLNNDRWWNTGAVLMLWSGANKSAAGAALHEGGHGFHQLADEYAGTNGNCTREYNEVNSTADMARTAGKWDRWLDYEQTGATGRQGAFAGSRYCEREQYRPSDNSMMNSLFGDNPNTSFNSVSREKIVFDIWRIVRPIDATTPRAGAVDNPSALSVQVIDPEVIDIDWSVDGELVAADGGATFDVAAARLSPGVHTVSARAHDNAGEDLVRYRDGGNMYGRMNWARSDETVTWQVTVP